MMTTKDLARKIYRVTIECSLGFTLGKGKFPVRVGCVSVRVMDQDLREIERIIWAEGYVDVADYVRNLIRKDFRERGLRLPDGWMRGEERADLVEVEVEIPAGRRRERRVFAHRRKADGKMYESPQFVLPPEFNRFIGRKYIVYEGRARITVRTDAGDPLIDEGEAIILIFRGEDDEEE